MYSMGVDPCGPQISSLTTLWELYAIWELTFESSNVIWDGGWCYILHVSWPVWSSYLQRLTDDVMIHCVGGDLAGPQVCDIRLKDTSSGRMDNRYKWHFSDLSKQCYIWSVDKTLHQDWYCTKFVNTELSWILFCWLFIYCCYLFNCCHSSNSWWLIKVYIYMGIEYLGHTDPDIQFPMLMLI